MCRAINHYWCACLKRGLEDAASPLEGERVRKVEDSLNQTPMFYLGMKSTRVALLRCHDTSRNSPYISPAEGRTVIWVLGSNGAIMERVP